LSPSNHLRPGRHWFQISIHDQICDILKHFDWNWFQFLIPFCHCVESLNKIGFRELIFPFVFS
jgi:hypothetical protein